MAKVRLIIHNIRSIHNVGSLLRTADCLGVEHVHITGYSSYPLQPNDERLPHQAQKAMRQLHKTALGAETNKNVTYSKDVHKLLQALQEESYRLVALEQHKESVPLPDYTKPKKLALLLGEEVKGVNKELLNEVQDIIEIPMAGKKESLNVVQAAAIAIYELATR